MRQIDRVTVKRSDVPLDLYTVDLDPSELQLEPLERVNLSRHEKKLKRVRARQLKNQLRKDAISGQMPISTLFETDPDLVQMRAPYPRSFYEQFEKGFKLYIDGDWANSKIEFEKIEFRDYPTLNLLDIMSDNDFKKPKGWAGYRVLTEK